MGIQEQVMRTYDCGHGRQLRVQIPGSSVACVTFDDPRRTNPILAARDRPSITLTLEAGLVPAVQSLLAGKLSGSEFAEILCQNHMVVMASEWRRSLVREFCSVAVPMNADRAIAEAMGVE